MGAMVLRISWHGMILLRFTGVSEVLIRTRRFVPVHGEEKYPGPGYDD